MGVWGYWICHHISGTKWWGSEAIGYVTTFKVLNDGGSEAIGYVTTSKVLNDGGLKLFKVLNNGGLRLLDISPRLSY